MSTETDFEAAFADGVGAEPEAPQAELVEDPVEAVSTEEPAVDTDAEPTAVEPDAIAEAESDPAPAVDQPAVVEPAAQAAAQPVAQMDTKQLATAIAEAQALAAQAKPKEQAPAAPQRDATFEDYLDDKQKKSLELFQAEWSDVAAPVTALIQAHVQAALANQQKQILGQVQQQMAPIQQHAAQSQEALYWGTIQAAHPDFREAAAEVPGWIEKQPKIYQPRLMEIYNAGSAQDVVELISMYKQAVGSTGAAPAHPASSAAQATPKQAPVPPAALAATLAPPKAQRGTVTATRDPNDADAAFNEAFAM